MPESVRILFYEVITRCGVKCRSICDALNIRGIFHYMHYNPSSPNSISPTLILVHPCL